MNNQSDNCKLDHILFSAMSYDEQNPEISNDETPDPGTTVRLNRIITS
jgi:hypothetical protein